VACVEESHHTALVAEYPVLNVRLCHTVAIGMHLVTATVGRARPANSCPITRLSPGASTAPTAPRPGRKRFDWHLDLSPEAMSAFRAAPTLADQKQLLQSYIRELIQFPLKVLDQVAKG